MSLQQWHENSWIHPVEPSSAEIANLLAVADREIGDAAVDGISADGRFGHAYAAARTLCQAALHAAGFGVPKGEGGHLRIIESLKLTLGSEWAGDADYLDLCRRLRHRLLYEQAGVTQQDDANQLLETAQRLRTAVEDWIREKHGHLLS